MKNRYSHPKLTCRIIGKALKVSDRDAIIKIRGKGGYYETTSNIEEIILNSSHTNIFIKENDLYDLLVESDIKISATHKELCENYPFNIRYINGNYNEVIVINSKRLQNSIIIGYSYFKEADFFAFYISNGKKINTFYYGSTDDIMNTCCAEMIPSMKLFLNLIFYAKAFPDKVIDGVPEDYREDVFRNIIINKGYTFLSHKSIMSSVTPHFRKGHFMRLESERYINKRWSIVWRCASMVRGYSAKTAIFN